MRDFLPQLSPLRPRTLWLVPLAVPLFALLAIAQLVASTPMGWEQAARVIQATWSAPWMFSALAFGVTLACPFERGRRGRSFVLHALALAAVLIVLGLFAPPGGPPREARERFAAEGPPLEAPPWAGPPGGRRGGAPDRRLWAMLDSTKTQLGLGAYLGTILLVQALRLQHTVRERDRRARELAASLTQARLSALQLQLQPHFLFNSLNAISTLVHRDPAAADEMITNLSELLRLSLATKAPVVPLRQELELLDRYLAIEQVRFGERLRVERRIAPDALDLFVPTLLLQPLAENAVRHGLEPKPGPGAISLVATVRNGRLRIAIEDDGVGLPARAPRDERRGVGLANTETRLRELYGTDASLALSARPDGGTRVELDLPAEPPLEALGLPPEISA